MKSQNSALIYSHYFKQTFGKDRAALKITRLKVIQVLLFLRWYFLWLAFSLLLNKTYSLHNDVTSGQTFENNMEHCETSQGMVKWRTWSTCAWLRGELVKAERLGRSCKRTSRRSKKQQSFQVEENLKKKYFRQKEGWMETSGDQYCHCPLLCALIIPVFSNRSDQKASILFSG